MKKLLLSFSCVVAMFALSAPNADAFILDGISYELLEDGSGVYVRNVPRQATSPYLPQLKTALSPIRL